MNLRAQLAALVVGCAALLLLLSRYATLQGAPLSRARGLFGSRGASLSNWGYSASVGVSPVLHKEPSVSQKVTVPHVAPLSQGVPVSQEASPTRPESLSGPVAPPSPPTNISLPSPPSAPPPPRPHPAGVQYTRSMYEAGHTWATPTLCPSLGARLAVLVLISSAPTHSRARAAIRLTWGHYAARADVALAFFVGRTEPPRPELEEALQTERALYGDLIRGRNVDSYSNLTLKTLSMLEWTSRHCPRAPALLKTDDDMFINVPRLLSFVTSRTASPRAAVWGKVVRRWLPKRAAASKYYVPEVQYPARVYPDFATGPAYLVSRSAVEPLLRAGLAPDARYVRLEDVYVTGVMAGRLNISRVHAPEFLNKRVPAQPCVVQRSLAVHMVRYHEQFDFWRKLLDGRARCT